MAAIVWVRLINAALTSRKKSHSPSLKQMLSSLQNKATKYSNSCPQHKCCPSMYLFFPCVFYQLSERTWLCPFIDALKGKRSKSLLIMSRVTLGWHLLSCGGITTKSRRSPDFQETFTIVRNKLQMHPEVVCVLNTTALRNCSAKNCCKGQRSFVFDNF